MAYINKNVSTMAMPSGMNRMGQFPLDMSSVYYDLESLQAYATSGAVAYVGQILSLVDEANNNVTLYAIKNTAGDLVEIAADIVMPEIPEVPEYSGEGAINVADYKISVVVDDETIKIVDGKLTAIIPEVEIPDITASDDDVVILTAEGHAVSAAHAKKGPEGGATKGAAADAEIKAFGGSIEFKVPNVTVDEYGHTTALDEKTIKVSIPNAPADNDTKTSVESGDDYIVVDGSLTENASNVFTVKINEATLKALIGSETTAAMEFKGATASLPENAQKGDIYKVSATFIVDAENNAESDEADPSGFITEVGDSIVAEGNGKWYLIPSGDDIEDTWRPVTNVDNDSILTFSAGSKLAVEVKADGSITYSHVAIDAPALVEGGSGRTYITELVSDGFGHITGYKVATESVVDTNDTYIDGDGIEVRDEEGSVHSVNIKLADGEAHLKITEDGALAFDAAGIDTDTNDTYSAGNGIEVSDDGEETHTISIKLADDEKNLVVGANGLATNFDLADYATNAEAKANSGIRYINQTEIDKLSKLTIDGDDVTISGSVEASQVKNLYSVIKNVVNSTSTTEDLDPEMTGLQTGLGIELGAQVNKIESVDTANFTITEAKQLTLVEGKHLITTAQVEKLDGIAAGAEKNFISTVDETKFTVTEGKLVLNENYVTTSVYSAEVGDLTKLIRDEGRENTTLVDEINYINERLTWGEMAE